ncbi:Hypothetical protein Tpal_115 [Trichococcus palustris]|uniref:Peptidase C39-like domain-containing protein n=1 Tax=Trichococcus palustris TaxID=140314 RepID=A0A143Y3G8_9LACT|nr:dihydrolipoamide dehydrogenase [Trichococcus palustris]CZQ80749.1 Hypothetical protein Tpal_115 [Trichococcus palustris]SFK63935.1 hypothetical protein SAMN04488076_102177 [Trichococcus palustris]
MEKETTKSSRDAKTVKESYPVKWIGLKPGRFAKYSTWINNEKPGICGTYCGAVLLHDAVLQKYQRSLDKDTLVAGLKTVVDDFMPYKGTFFWDVQHGLNELLKDIPDWTAKTGIITEKIVPQLLDRPDPVPVIVGTTKLLHSKYKNHWVVVYAYGYNEEGKLFYKVYDNHGRHQAIIPASQTIGCIWLEEKNKR